MATLRTLPHNANTNIRRFRTALRSVFGAAGLCLIIYAAVVGYHYTQVQLGPFAPLAAIIFAVLLVSIFGPLLLIHYYHSIASALVHSLRWVARLAASSALPRRFARRYPRLIQFWVRRFAPGKPSGISLSAWAIFGVIALEQVVELTLEVTRGNFVPALDQRIENLVAIMRTPELDHLFYAVTWFGSAATIAPLAAAALLVALLSKGRRRAVLLPSAATVSWLSVEVMKRIVARPRPPLVDARVLETSFSFPSGHATVSAAFYGVAAYLLIRLLYRETARVAVGILAALLVVAVGISRMYLGVHYPSDVLAGWMLGIFWLAATAIIDHLWRVWRKPSKATALGSDRIKPLPAVLFVGLAAVSVGSFISFKVATLPPVPNVGPGAPIVIASDGVLNAIEQRLPHYTEGLTGDRQEPVSIVFVGTRAQLEAVFEAAGWTESEQFSFSAVSEGVRAAITHQSAPAGPVTPAFLAKQPNLFAFSRPVGRTFAERHHIRLWSTAVQTEGRQSLWLATASFDRGFELAPSTGLPTHQIDPNIDAERSFVVRSLQQTGLVRRTQTVQLVPAETGVNFDGDPFHTDGRAVIINLDS